MAKAGEHVDLAPFLGDGFDQPHEISELLQAFPGQLGDLMPAWEIIPEEFKNWQGTEWNRFVKDWFFNGWPEHGLFEREDVNAEKAYVHLRTILKSFEPKQEHKEAAVSWLASRWFAAVGEPKEIELP